MPGKRSCSISPRPQSLASKRACYDTSECRKSFCRVGVQSDIVTVNLTVVLDRVQRKGPRWVGKRDASLMAWKRLKRERFSLRGENRKGVHDIKNIMARKNLISREFKLQITKSWKICFLETFFHSSRSLLKDPLFIKFRLNDLSRKSRHWKFER